MISVIVPLTAGVLSGTTVWEGVPRTVVEASVNTTAPLNIPVGDELETITCSVRNGFCSASYGKTFPAVKLKPPV